MEAYLFILPPLAVLFILIGYPVIYNIYLSFFQSGYGVHTFVGLANYVQAFRSPGFGNILLNTLIWTVGNMAIMLVLGMFAALSLNRELRGKTAIQVLLLIPWVVPFVVTGVMWTFLFQPRWGAVNDILLRLNLISERILWLEKPNTALMSVMIAYVWKVYPYVMLLLLAGMKSIPEEVYDAAEVDGANGLRRLLHITLPMLRSILSTIMLVVGIWTFNAFDLIYVMTGGGPIYSSETIAMRIYKLAFMDFRFGLSSATSMIASVILILLCIIYPRLEKE
ncbi:MAG: sugar ABC transporter permease [Chloroflexi bacterium]|nr:sugar ABC transporter permease [Chloroflexota bacterium]